MALTKQHYIAIAGAIRQSYSAAPYSRLSTLTDTLAGIFAEDNPRFDSTKFRLAARDPQVDETEKELDNVAWHKKHNKPALKEVEEVLGITVEKLIGG